jgi:hypothetical protein
MKFHRILALATIATMVGLPTAEAIGLGGRGGVNSGGVEMGEPSRLQKNLADAQMNRNIALDNAARSPAGPNVGLTTGVYGNRGLGAQTPLLSAEPVNRVVNQRREAPREPVRSYNANAIDSDGNIYFSPGVRSSRIRD